MSTLPQHDEITTGRRVVEAISIALALALLIGQSARLLMAPAFVSWSTLAAAVFGMLAADLLSGLIHWTADTWFQETMPILGRRLLRPFRVHHVNPEDFLRRQFLTVNGDVSLICIPFLLFVFAIPLDANWGRLLAVFVVSFAAVGLPTNQVHQWAHMPRPPRWVQWLQQRRIVLSRDDHARHHCPPYAQFYCIATGWLNRPLTRLDFFRRAERLVTALTGLKPRDDDHQFQKSIEEQVGIEPVRDSAT